jgi:LPXTG-motif cell wall-anchored protein
LIAYGIYQLQGPQREDPTLRRANWLLIVACLAQIAWVYLFTFQLFWLSVAAMLVILISLIAAYLALDIGQTRVSRDRRWLVHTPFSIYLGWISVATIVNVASALYISGWNGWGIPATGWTIVMLLIGAIVGGMVAIQRADVAFTGVFVWAYVAIALRQLSNPNIALTAGGVAIALIALLLLGRRRRATPLQSS